MWTLTRHVHPKNSGSASMDYRRVFLKVMEMQEPQDYAQNQFSEERRQRVSQAKKR